MLGGRRNSRVVFHRRCPVLMVRPVRSSPGRWALARGLPEVLAQVRLVAEAATQSDVTQGRIGRQHELSGQFHATLHQESMRWLPEGALEGSREVRLATLNERTEIRDEYRPCDMTINIVTHLAHLPGQQAPPCVGNLSRSWRIKLLAQECGCFEYCTLGSVVLIMKLTNRCVKERNHPVHPCARSRRT